MNPNSFSNDRTARPYSRAVMDGYARHAAAANGFGDAGLAFAGVRTVRRPAIAHRPQPLGGVVGRAFRAMLDLVATQVADWRRARLASATDAALQSLDDRALHDIGLDRSEISSFAASAGRDGDPTRVRMSQAQHGLVV
jgi:uncharacterized protein YjiS (DUF1127 family)